jgi:site-specific DNA-methyltransferase (adenine-specific)/modification methylase
MTFCIRQCELNPHDTLCDPYMGAGATGIAAVRDGLEFIGIEIEPKYFDVARRRIQKAIDAPSMFVEPRKPVKQETFL